MKIMMKKLIECTLKMSTFFVGGKVMNKIKFNEIINEYLSFKRMYVRHNTMISYEERINNYILPYFADRDIFSITKEDIINWQKDLFEKGVSIKYINKIRPVLHNIFSYLCDYHGCDNNPVTHVPRLRDNSPYEEMDFWEFEEFKKFAKSIDDPLYYRFFMFLYYTGARKGEARAMTWKQIDFKNNLITISRSLERRKDKNGNYIINRPKNDHSRTIMLNSELRDVLLIYYSERKRHFDFDEKEYLFGIKKPLADSTIENRKNKYCDKSGVKKIRIHDFRHSNVSLLVSLGADICVICSRLGHKDRNQTLNRYSHMFPSKEGEIVDKIDNQASIYNSYSVTLANVIVDFLEKVNQLKNLEEKDIIMIEQIKKIM